MLALRYLNPLRTYFSVITLICLAGVAIGIMVLIVVLSIMNGLQRDLKSRFLAYTPHVKVSYYYDGQISLVEDWRNVVDSLKDAPGVVAAYPIIEDFVLVDAGRTQKPALFRAIDMENEDQMKDIAALIEPGGSAELGMEDEAIISVSMANSMGLSVGDTIRIYAKRNYEGVIHAFNQRERSLKKNEAERLSALSFMWKKVEVKDGLEWLPNEKVTVAQDAWYGILERNKFIRKSEEEIVSSALLLLDEPIKEEGDRKGYALGSAKKYNSVFEALNTLDTDKEDLEAFESVKSVVLPRDLTVIGTYLTSRRIGSPDIFIPINVAQELLGFEDPREGGYWDVVQGIAVRAKDPYVLEPVQEAVVKHLPEAPRPEGSWDVRNWMNDPNMETFVDLMHQERVMISFVLFTIMLVSVFCIMAVMFASAIQRKKEIAVMKALGARPGQIVQVFLWQGIIIGIIGVICGVSLGFYILYERVGILDTLSTLGFRPFPTQFHGVSRVPCYIDMNEVFMISGIAFLLVILASIIPALLTSRQDPAKSLRGL